MVNGEVSNKEVLWRQSETSLGREKGRKLGSGPKGFPNRKRFRARALMVSVLPVRMAGQSPGCSSGSSSWEGSANLSKGPAPPAFADPLWYYLPMPPVNIISIDPHQESETNLANHPHFPPGDPEALRSQGAFPKFQILPECGIMLSDQALPRSFSGHCGRFLHAVNLGLTRWPGGKAGERRQGF